MPLIVLLTDFGSKDYFVAVMKGVISKINPLSKIVDLTHEIEPQNVREAAFVLWASRKFFPEDTIFVNVVDPGVGSERKVICGNIDGQLFIAPDNGLLDYVVAEAKGSLFYEVTNRKYYLSGSDGHGFPSTTFHGRDIFAPVAGYLSRGVSLNELGNFFRYPAVKAFYKKVEDGMNAGEIVYKDRFGNVFTNLLWTDVLFTRRAKLKIGGRVISEFVKSYYEGKSKKLICVKGSSGLIEIAVNLGNASKLLKAKMGQKVTLVLE
jgi:S-adenosylmethionine hydrolase